MMRFRSRYAALSASLGLMVAAAVAIALMMPISRPERGVLVGYGVSGPLPPVTGTRLLQRSTFSIAGDVPNLFPGTTHSLVLTITNPRPYAITITSISTSVGDASVSCPSSYLTVTPFSGALNVAAFHRASTSVAATMSHAAPDGCEGAVFPLRYTGQAYKT